MLISEYQLTKRLNSDLSFLSIDPHLNFLTEFNIISQREGLRPAVHFVENFSNRYPLSHSLIKQAYKTACSLGLFNLARECGRVYAETCSKLINIAKTELGLPPVYQYSKLLGQSNCLVDHAAYAKEMLDFGMIDQKPVLWLIENNEKTIKQAFKPYLRECFEIFEGTVDETPRMDRLGVLSPFDPVFYKHSITQYGHNRQFFYDCHSDLVAKPMKRFQFVLKDITLEKAKQFLVNYDLNINEKFIVVCFNQKDNRSIDPNQHVKLNLNPNEYKDSINYLINQGFKVVKICDHRLVEEITRPGFINLTGTERPHEVDISLCGRAKFFLGNEGSYYGLSYHFGVPIVEPGRLDFGGTRPNTFVRILNLNDLATGKRIDLANIRKLELPPILTASSLKQVALSSSVPTSGENLLLMKEACEYFENGSIYLLNESYKIERQRSNIWGGLASQSLPLINNSKIEFGYE